MTAKRFLDAVCSISLENVFNPYLDRCAACDVHDAPKLRKNALNGMLNAAVQQDIDSIWIGRDLGYRGGRRTGLALTDDVHLAAHAKRWDIEIKRATKGEFVKERTADVIWGKLNLICDPIFLWNVFPFHPYEPENFFTNRAHNSTERKIGEGILFELIKLLKPRRLIAIGNDAAEVAHRLKYKQDVVQIRHPSYGGQNIFIQQVKCLYKIIEPTQPLLI
jgi:hypothetical protein